MCICACRSSSPRACRPIRATGLPRGDSKSELSTAQTPRRARPSRASRSSDRASSLQLLMFRLVHTLQSTGGKGIAADVGAVRTPCAQPSSRRRRYQRG
eukprot:2287703-Prymnesium_polylepis.1